MSIALLVLRLVVGLLFMGQRRREAPQLRPLACAGRSGQIAAVMCTAIATVRWRKGLWNAGGGFEFPLVMLTAAFAITALGPHGLSIDGWAGLDGWLNVWSCSPAVMTGAAVGAGAVAAALALGLAQYRKMAGRQRITPIAPKPA